MNAAKRRAPWSYKRLIVFALASFLALAACGSEAQLLSDESAVVRDISLFTDDRIAAAEGTNVHLWRDGDETTTVFNHTTRVNTVATLNNGRILSGGSDGLVRIWDPTQPNAEPIIFTAHIGQVLAIAELPDGRVASGDNHEELHIWDPNEPAPRPDFTLSTSSAALGLLPDGRLVSTHPQQSLVQIWDPSTPDAQPDVVEYHEGIVRAIDVLADGRVATGDIDGLVQVWDPQVPNADPTTLLEHEGEVHAVTALDDGRIVTGGADGSVIVWDLTEPTSPVSVFDERDAVRSLATTSTGVVLAGFNDGKLRTWDPSSDER